MSAHELFRSFLLDRGLTYRRAGELLGCSGTMVFHLVRGDRPPGLTLAVTIERVTDGWARGPIRPWQWLVAANDNEPPAEDGAA